MTTVITSDRKPNGTLIPCIEGLNRPHRVPHGAWRPPALSLSAPNRGQRTFHRSNILAEQFPHESRISVRVPRSDLPQPAGYRTSESFPVGVETPPTVPPIPRKYQQPVRSRASKDQRHGVQNTQDLPLVANPYHTKFTGCLNDIQDTRERDLTAQSKAYRFSQIVDIPSGNVHRRQLSECLREILDSSFEVQQLPAHTIDIDMKIQLDQEIAGHEHSQAYETNSVGGNHLIPSQKATRQHLRQSSDVYYVSRCQCPPGAIICHCQSSEEFKRFYQCHRERKANSSVSSTVCMLSVPRARFRTLDTIPDDNQSLDSTKAAKLRSARCFNTGASQSTNVQVGDWPLPLSPNKCQNPNQSSISTNASATSDTRSCDAKLTSFSRPFRPESGGSPRLYYGSPSTSSGSGVSESPVTPTSPFKHPSSARSGAKIAHLDSMSTLSTFNLDSNDPFVTDSAPSSKCPMNEMTRPNGHELRHSSVSVPYSFQISDAEMLYATGNRPQMAAYPTSSNYSIYSSVQLATATTKSVVAMSRPLSRSSEKSSQSWESYSSHQTSGVKSSPGSPVFQRPRLINVSG